MDPSPDLVVAGGHAAASGTWCGSFNDDERGGGDGCEDTQSYFAVFSTRTGNVLRGGLSAERRRLVAGDRPTELVRRPGTSSVLRDVVTNRTLMTVPSSAFSVQGAGRFVAWKTGKGPDDWTRMHVRRRGTGHDRYALSLAHVERTIHGKDEPVVDEATVTAGGSVDLDVVTGSGHAVAVDDRLPDVAHLPLTRAQRPGC